MARLRWCAMIRRRGRRPRQRVAALLLLLAGSAPAAAEEMLVQGEIVSVEPVLAAGASRADDACRPPQPSADAALTELLAWDLRVDCPRAPRVTGYRVSYRWDGRTYEQVMREPPAGDTISLRVRLR